MPTPSSPKKTNSKKLKKPRYKRIVLKLSGESLEGKKDVIDPQGVRGLCSEIKEIHNMGVQVAIVIGGGNIWRGLSASNRGMDRTTADYMGMLATVINSLALQNTLEELGVPTRVQSSFDMKNVAEPFIRRRAIRHLEKKRVVIFAAGTGNPFFSTDTAAALRANEISADVILKATKVDGIYDCDPMKNPKAKKYNTLSYKVALEQRLKVMDSTAFSLCMDNQTPLIVFNMFKKGNLKKIFMGQKIGTYVDDTPSPKKKK